MSRKGLFASLAVAGFMLLPVSAYGVDILVPIDIPNVKVDSISGNLIIDLKAAGCNTSVMGQEYSVFFNAEPYGDDFGGGIMFCSKSAGWCQYDDYAWSSIENNNPITAEEIRPGEYVLSFVIPEGVYDSYDFTYEEGYADIYIQQWWGESIEVTEVDGYGFKTSVQDGWFVDGWRYKYAVDGRLQRDKWLYIGKKWYYFDHEGYMASDTVLKDVSGNTYYFFLDGSYLKSGWYLDEDSNWKYAYPDGRLAIGLAEIDGTLYAFDETGRMCYDGVCTYNYDDYVYAESSGKVLKGWFQRDGQWYYADDKGKLAKGLTKIGNSVFYFDYDYVMMSSYVYTDGSDIYVFDKNGYGTKKSKPEKGWVKAGDNYAYFENGSQIIGEVKTIDGVTYCFKEGMLAKNEYIRYYSDETNENVFYYANASGVAYEGWTKNDAGQWAYFEKGGKAANGLKTIGGKTYFFKTSYEYGIPSYITMAVNENVCSGDKWYHADVNGYCTDLNVPAGWRKENGNWVYYSTEIRGEKLVGMQYISGSRYFFDDNGVMLTGVIDYRGYNLYADSNGRIATGWTKVGTNWYYFDYYAYRNGLYYIDNQYYYFDDNGVMMTGLISDGDKKYYATASGAIAQGWVKANGKWYYSTDNGLYTGLKFIDDKTEVFDENGVWIETINKAGWYQLGNKWGYTSTYYNYDDATGESSPIYYRFCDSAYNIDGTYYLFDEYGFIRTNGLYYRYGSVSYADKNGALLTDSWKQIDGNWYYFDYDGRSVNGWKTIGRNKYHFTNYVMDTGVVAINDVEYLFNSQGVFVSEVEKKDGWHLVNGDYYYYKNNKLLKGLNLIDGKYYYLDNSTGKMYSDMTYGFYHIRKDGSIATSGWYYDKQYAKYYYLDGLVQYYKGLHTIGGKKYYFESDGTLLTGTKLINKHNYYSYNGKEFTSTIYRANKDGEILEIINPSQKGWVTVGEDKYYCDGEKFVTGVCYIDGNYYFLENGVVVSDDLYIDLWDNDYGYYDGLIDSEGVIHTNCDYYGFKFIDGHTVWGENEINGKYYYSDRMPYYIGGGRPEYKDVANCVGIYQVRGKWYIYDGKGNRKEVTVKTGWVLSDGYYYYMKDGEAVKSIFYFPTEINGVLYYLDPFTGRMAANEDKVGYHFDSNGAGTLIK